MVSTVEFAAVPGVDEVAVATSDDVAFPVAQPANAGNSKAIVKNRIINIVFLLVFSYYLYPHNEFYNRQIAYKHLSLNIFLFSKQGN
jgi:hypothetical protein